MNLRTLGTRTLVAAILGPLIIFMMLYGRLPFLCLVVIITVISEYEFFKIIKAKGFEGQEITAILAAIALLCVLYYFSVEKVWIVLSIFLIVVLITELYRSKANVIANLSSTVFAVCYLSFLFGHLILIRELPKAVNIPYAYAGRWIVMMFLVTWACDTAAYILGSAWGRHKLMKKISPNKTIEGTLAGFVVALLSALVCHFWFIKGISVFDSLVIGAICGSVGQYGDLVESMIKRNVGVKDTSTIIPGHGGMMDRFDSPLLSAPIIYLFLRFVTF